MDNALFRKRIAATLQEAYGQGVQIQECDEVPGVGNERKVHKLSVATPAGDHLKLFAKTGTDSQVRIEAALYQSVFGSDFAVAPRFIAATEDNGVHCFITEEVAGEPLDDSNQDHVVAAFRALAELHRLGRPHVGALIDAIHGPTTKVAHFTNPRDMFDRVFMIWGLATAFGITRDDLDIFYGQRVLDLVLEEEWTFVHGDFSPNNLLINPDTLDVRFIDFGFGEVRAASSDLLFEFDYGKVFGDHLHAGLQAYWEASDQGVSYETFRLRQAYWHASYYADVFSWYLTKQDLEDEDLRSGRMSALECIRTGGRYIAEHIAAS